MVRTRFAPSPTGSLHVGGARTALYCWLHARHHGGQFLLRIEDTDQARSSEEAAAGILRDMRWLGLLWDEGPEVGGPDGPYFQAQRLDLYRSYVDQLLASGHAYHAWETREELGALRDAAEADGGRFKYKRRPYTEDDLARFAAEGRTPVVRLAAPTHDITVDDVVVGPATQTADELEDIVILKADGFPTYHFAVVVDDHHMRITQVARGKEHLMNTHKHVGIYEALGWPLPSFAHLPTIMAHDGSGKMSKRAKAREARAGARDHAKANGLQGLTWLAELTGLDLDELVAFMKKKHDQVSFAEAIAKALNLQLPMIDVLDYQKGGYLPEALLNYLSLLGWSPGDDRELMSLDELTAAFTLDRVKKTDAKFDPTKLEWMNGEYLKNADIDRLVAAMDGWLEVYDRDTPLREASPATRRRILELYQARARTLVDLDQQARLFFEAPTTWADKPVKKFLLKGGGLDNLARAREALAAVDDWSEAPITAALEALAASLELGMGKVAQPVRVAVTGTGVSPGIDETLALIGKEQVLARIDACLATVGG